MEHRGGSLIVTKEDAIAVIVRAKHRPNVFVSTQRKMPYWRLVVSVLETDLHYTATRKLLYSILVWIVTEICSSAVLA